jgi:hypothetical protein
MTEEDIEALAEKHALAAWGAYYDTPFTDLANDLTYGTASKNDYMAGYKAASKEEVSWDEAFCRYTEDKSFHSIFISWLKENYALIPKTK